MVVAFHIWATAAEQGYETLYSIFRHGEAGVDLFFVISGFIIYYTSATRKNLTARTFAVSRFLRIFPTYWAVLGLYLGIWLLNALGKLSVPVSFEVTPLSALSSIALFPFPNQIIPVAWTLTIEVLFYALFCATFFRFGARGFFLAMIAWAAAAQLYALTGAAHSPWLSFTLYGGVVEFLFGAIIARLFLRGQHAFHVPLLAAGLGLMFLWLAGAQELSGSAINREWGAGVASALILYGLLGFAISLPAPLLLLAEASYVIYLTHLLLISVALRVFGKMTGASPFGSFWMTSVVFVAVVAAGCLIHLWLERPFQRQQKKWLAT